MYILFYCESPYIGELWFSIYSLYLEVYLAPKQKCYVYWNLCFDMKHKCLLLLFPVVIRFGWETLQDYTTKPFGCMFGMRRGKTEIEFICLVLLIISEKKVILTSDSYCLQSARILIHNKLLHYLELQSLLSVCKTPTWLGQCCKCCNKLSEGIISTQKMNQNTI